MHFDFNKRHEEFPHPGFLIKTSPSLLARNLDNKGPKVTCKLFFKKEETVVPNLTYNKRPIQTPTPVSKRE